MRYRSNLRAFTGKNQGMTEFRADGGWMAQLVPGPREQWVSRMHQILSGGYADGGQPLDSGLFKWLPSVQHTLQRGLSGLVPGVPPPPSPGLTAMPQVNAAPVSPVPSAPRASVPQAGGVRMKHGGKARRLAHGGAPVPFSSWRPGPEETMSRHMPVTSFSGASGQYLHALKQYNRGR